MWSPLVSVENDLVDLYQFLYSVYTYVSYSSISDIRILNVNDLQQLIANGVYLKNENYCYQKCWQALVVVFR